MAVMMAHFHPDHRRLAGWLCVPFYASHLEHLQGRCLSSVQAREMPWLTEEFIRRAEQGANIFNMLGNVLAYLAPTLLGFLAQINGYKEARR